MELPLATLATPVRKKLPDLWVHRRPDRSWVDGGGRFFGWQHALHVLGVLTRHEFRERYRARALGIIWSLINPIVMMGILTMVFSRIFRNTTPNFPIFILIGIVVWQFITAALNSATGAFLTHAEIVKRTVFPRQLVPIAVLGSFTFNFFIESAVLLIFVPVFPDAFRMSWALLYVPVLVLFLVLLLTGLALMTSVLNVIYRDVSYLVNTILLIAYWLTPVIYSLDVIPEPYRTILSGNPFGIILTGLRGAVMLGTGPTLTSWASLTLTTLFVLLCGGFVFRHYESMVLDHV